MNSEEVKNACAAIRKVLSEAIFAELLTQYQIDAVKGNVVDKIEELALEALAKREDDQ